MLDYNVIVLNKLPSPNQRILPLRWNHHSPEFCMKICISPDDWQVKQCRHVVSTLLVYEPRRRKTKSPKRNLRRDVVQTKTSVFFSSGEAGKFEFGLENEHIIENITHNYGKSFANCSSPCYSVPEKSLLLVNGCRRALLVNDWLLCVKKKCKISCGL